MSVLIFYVSFWTEFLDWSVHFLNAIMIEGEISAILKHMNETIESTIIISIFENVYDFQV